MKYCIYIFFFAAFTVYAQWNPVENISRATPIPAIYYDGAAAIACADSVIYISEDNGNTWIQSAKIDTTNYVTAAVKYENKFFVGTLNIGVYESSDGGKTWNQFNNGFSGLGSNIISKLEIRGDSLYAGTMGAGIFVLDLKNSSTWKHFSEGLYWNYSYSVYSLKNIKGRLFTGAGVNAFYYINEPNSTYWNEYKMMDFNSMVYYDIKNYAQNIFIAGSWGLFTSTDGAQTFLLSRHNIGAIIAANIALHGSDIYIAFTKELRTFWYKSVDFGNSINMIEDQPGFEVFSAAIIGNKLFAGRADGLWFRDLDKPTNIEDKIIPANFRLEQNYPNPFNPATTINYAVVGNADFASAVHVTLKIYDVLGSEVAVLVNEYKLPGNYSVEFRAKSDEFAGGVYFYRLNAGSFSETKKMILLK